MKKTILILLFVPLFSLAQKAKKINAKPAVKVETAGVHFQHKITNWDALIAQAKKDNKFIFVDCFTTWCGPCKYVSTKVFPMSNVGDFFNKNFINVGLQIDETLKDNQDVVATRRVAKEIESKYNIGVYPTFLIFNNDGELVHKFVGAGDDKFMIENAKNGLSKETQYYTLVNEFNQGKRDSKFISQLCKAASNAGDNAEEYVKAFIETQNDLYTKENADFLLSNAESADGTAFKQLYEHKEKWLEVSDRELYRTTIANIISNEILNEIFSDKKNDVNWTELENKYQEKYPVEAKEQVAKAKVIFYAETKDWKKFTEELKILLKQNADPFGQKEMVNSIAWTVFENIEDKDLLNEVLTLSKKLIENDKASAYLDTYANLLYKLGRTNEAIEAETNAMNNASNSDEKKSYQLTLSKMKKGEKTWK